MTFLVVSVVLADELGTALDWVSDFTSYFLDCFILPTGPKGFCQLHPSQPPLICASVVD